MSNRAATVRWNVRTAKARLNQLIQKALTEGPQYVTGHRNEEVVMLSAEEFERLTRRFRQPESLVDFFAHSPLTGAKLDLKRKRDPRPKRL